VRRDRSRFNRDRQNIRQDVLSAERTDLAIFEEVMLLMRRGGAVASDVALEDFAIDIGDVADGARQTVGNGDRGQIKRNLLRPQYF
jgi:hypothetical protein